jgi:serine/alanine racemase
MDTDQLEYQILAKESQDEDSFSEIFIWDTDKTIAQMVSKIENLQKLGEDAPPYKFIVAGRALTRTDLRNIGKVTGEILILTWTPVSEKETLIKYNLTQTLIDYEYAKKLNEAPGGIVKCHIKVDTGLGRFGHKVEEIDLFKKMFELKNLKILGIFSHVCRETEYEEEANNFTRGQMEKFNTVIEKLEKEGFNVGIKHLMDSLGTLRFNDKRYDMIRPGLVLYGLPASINSDDIKKTLKDNNMKPIASLKCHVMTVKTIEKGEKIGYNNKYTAEEKTKIATISIGFVD